MLDPRLSLQNDKEGKGERESLVLRLTSLRPKVDTCTLNSIVPLEQRDDINNDYVHAWLNLHIEEYYGLYGLFYTFLKVFGHQIESLPQRTFIQDIKLTPSFSTPLPDAFLVLL